MDFDASTAETTLADVLDESDLYEDILVWTPTSVYARLPGSGQLWLILQRHIRTTSDGTIQYSVVRLPAVQTKHWMLPVTPPTCDPFQEHGEELFREAIAKAQLVQDTGIPQSAGQYYITLIQCDIHRFRPQLWLPAHGSTQATADMRALHDAIDYRDICQAGPHENSLVCLADMSKCALQDVSQLIHQIRVALRTDDRIRYKIGITHAPIYYDSPTHTTSLGIQRAYQWLLEPSPGSLDMDYTTSISVYTDIPHLQILELPVGKMRCEVFERHAPYQNHA